MASPSKADKKYSINFDNYSFDDVSSISLFLTADSTTEHNLHSRSNSTASTASTVSKDKNQFYQSGSNLHNLCFDQSSQRSCLQLSLNTVQLFNDQLFLNDGNESSLEDEDEDEDEVQIQIDANYNTDSYTIIETDNEDGDDDDDDDDNDDSDTDSDADSESDSDDQSTINSHSLHESNSIASETTVTSASSASSIASKGSYTDDEFDEIMSVLTQRQNIFEIISQFREKSMISINKITSKNTDSIDNTDNTNNTDSADSADSADKADKADDKSLSTNIDLIFTKEYMQNLHKQQYFNYIVQNPQANHLPKRRLSIKKIFSKIIILLKFKKQRKSINNLIITV
ncbi:uncharacterized protein ASCRUDRAFT_82967 [Ascoidea rubescens DSM 1968]|uniref:Uncharacterized protein n=1 Tax=Ascoidea rubescens DSM 1968 TaxID=1344418 RepID=A0A1D2V9K0_9ASCO|nr:hypothetical protein ASCRUDRAFT_82967 [Ascoidea rubescens DSM 1968]ODV58167.1 hypothetical protein ASCRUDRAFT_82967 [Ascoidea rubescens DSM 1968]